MRDGNQKMKNILIWSFSTLCGALIAYFIGCVFVFGVIERSSNGMFGGTHFVIAAFLTIPAYLIFTFVLSVGVSEKYVWRQNPIHSLWLQPTQCLLVLLSFYAVTRLILK